jgi:hypothetical protein
VARSPSIDTTNHDAKEKGRGVHQLSVESVWADETASPFGSRNNFSIKSRLRARRPPSCPYVSHLPVCRCGTFSVIKSAPFQVVREHLGSRRIRLDVVNDSWRLDLALVDLSLADLLGRHFVSRCAVLGDEVALDRCCGVLPGVNSGIGATGTGGGERPTSARSAAIRCRKSPRRRNAPTLSDSLFFCRRSRKARHHRPL